jgi:hypothetical protein
MYIVHVFVHVKPEHLEVFKAATIENARNNATINDTLYTLNKGRYEVGKIGENDLLQNELALLRSRNALNNARLEFDRTLAALRLRLNLPVDAPLTIDVTGDVPTVQADTTIAVAQALRNRAEVTQQELQTVQAKRRVSEARYNTGFGAQLQASVGYNQSASDLDLAYRDLRDAQRFSLALSMPLIQWGARSAGIEAAKAEEVRAESNRRLAREELMQEAHFAALQLDQSRSQLELSAKADTVANKRFEVAKNRYIIGRIGIDNLFIAQNEKDQALQQYVQALRGYWLAYYRLRRTTLYDFARTAIRQCVCCPLTGANCPTIPHGRMRAVRGAPPCLAHMRAALSRGPPSGGRAGPLPDSIVRRIDSVFTRYDARPHPVCTSCTRRKDRLQPWLRDGKPRARHRHHFAHGVRHRFDVEAVHGQRDRAVGAGREADAR